jgi:Zn-dependent protease
MAMLIGMFTSWRLGRIFGFPVEINLSFLLLLAVVFIASGGFTAGGFMGVFIIGLAFGSVLLHELGHALVARRLGVHVSGIELSFLGGAAKMMQMPRSANHEIAIAAAGPAVSLMLGGAGLGLGALLHAPFIAMIGWINLVIAGFNLIPALPMDGGRILRALLTRRMDFVRATEAAVVVARAVTVAFVVFGLVFAWYQLVLLAPFLWIMSTRERDLARAMVDRYPGDGDSVDVFRRGAGPFDVGGFGDRFRPGGFGFHRDEDELDRRAHRPAARRFTIRRIGGRLVIETIE